MWEPLQRFRALDGGSQRLFLRASCLIPYVRASLRLRGYNRTYERLRSKLHGAFASLKTPIESREQVRRTAYMVHASVRYGVMKSSCLEESLTLWYLLRKQGLEANLRIGVRKDKEKFEAHAWVEYEGEPLNQSEEVHLHYRAFEQEIIEPPTESR